MLVFLKHIDMYQLYLHTYKLTVI